ncbi:MAG TPA: hypothetical protein VG452_10725 [Egibacteraceae bacterium]|nr:hypothetical protein [Egibacteraceae bacterium]
MRPARGRRAPRLGPGERIAPHLTRVGRFRALDPLQARPLPAWPRLAGALVWALLVEECLRRARARTAAGPGAG